MNIMEFCLGPGLGGLELYVYKTSVEMAKTDNVYAVISHKGKLAEKFKDSKLPIIYFEKGTKNFPLYKAFKLAKIIDTNNIDVIHMHWARDLSLLALAKWLSNRKPRLIYTRHMQITRNKDDFYHRFIYQQVDVFITITRNMKKSFRRFLDSNNKDKVVLLYHGVEAVDNYISEDKTLSLRNKVGFKPSDFVIALFGRIEKYKGQHVLIDAIAKLNQQGQDVKCLIVGHAMDNEYLASIKNTVKQNNIENNVYFMDFVENPQEWMQACELVVLTTKEETFGLVLAEAMQARVAVIGTNSGGVPEIIEHDKSGYLFDYGDVDSLSKFIQNLKENTNKRIEFANVGQKKAKALFDVEQHYVELRKILSGEN